METARAVVAAADEISKRADEIVTARCRAACRAARRAARRVANALIVR